MNLLKSKTVWYAIVIAVLSIGASNAYIVTPVWANTYIYLFSLTYQV